MDEIPPRAPSPPLDAIRHTYPPPPQRAERRSFTPFPLPIRGRRPERLQERSNEELEELLFDFESDDDDTRKEAYKLLPPMRNPSHDGGYHRHHENDRDDGWSSYRQPTVVTISSEGSDNGEENDEGFGGISSLNILKPERKRQSRHSRDGDGGFRGYDEELE